MKIKVGKLNLVKTIGQIFQVSFNNKPKEEVQNMSPYGIFSSPPKNTKTILFPFLNSFFALFITNKVPANVETNDVAIYNPENNSVINLKKNGNIIINAEGNCNITINGTCNINAETIINNGSNKVLTEATIINDSLGSPCTIVSGASNDLKTT